VNDEGLADVEAASPFRLPRLHPGGAPDPIKLGARKMGGNLGSVGTRETPHYAISHGAGVRFRTNCAIPERQPAASGTIPTLSDARTGEGIR
jgi:hypothetical protein